MLERIRSKTFAALASKVGDRVAPVRWTKAAALYVNDVIGRPLAPADELEQRAAFEARMQQRRADAAVADTNAAAAQGSRRQAAPVVVFHRDKHYVELEKLKDFLDSRGVPYQVRNIEGDEAAISAVKMEGRGYRLPVVFIAGDAVGGLEQVLNMDKRGELMPAIYGDDAGA